MRLNRLFNLLVVLTLLVAPGLAGQASVAQAAPHVSPAAVIAWSNIAVQTAVTVAKLFIPQSLVYISFEQAAVYDAVVAIEGRYAPYKLHLKHRPRASVDAAVAAAAHDTLVHYFPAQQAALDTDYANSLAAIADGKAKTDGIAVGQAAAAGIIALRQGDGLEADIGFVMPTPAPGVWQLPSSMTPQTPWLSKLRPFMLKSPDQFRPGPPPALSSSQWATDFNEVKSVGASTSTVRTADQTDIARFWTSNGAVQYNALFQNIIAQRGLDAVQSARLFAMGNLVGADALIACFDAKYHYLFWRPLFAVPLGDTDGNPATVGDPAWTPLIGTPNHPEYPSAHGCFTGAESEMLAGFFHTQHINVTFTANVANVVQTTRHFDTANDLVQEVENARIWGGIHYRTSVLTGVEVGRSVADWTLERYFGRADD